jgi:hypothetical protein
MRTLAKRGVRFVRANIREQSRTLFAFVRFVRLKRRAVHVAHRRFSAPPDKSLPSAFACFRSSRASSLRAQVYRVALLAVRVKRRMRRALLLHGQREAVNVSASQIRVAPAVYAAGP